MLIEIHKGDLTHVTENFTEAELYSTSKDAKEIHLLDIRCVEAFQLIRDRANDVFSQKVRVRVTSTFRTPAGNALIFGAKDSPHKKCIAVDAVLCSDLNPHFDVEVHQWWLHQIQSEGHLYWEIRSMGIAGIGLYPNFIHLDTRTESDHNYFNRVDRIGKLSLWSKVRMLDNSSNEMARKDKSVSEGANQWYFILLGLFLVFPFMRKSLSV